MVLHSITARFSITPSHFTISLSNICHMTSRKLRLPQCIMGDDLHTVLAPVFVHTYCKMETTGMWGLTLVITYIKRYQMFSNLSLFCRNRYKIQFRKLSKLNLSFIHVKNHPKYACMISPDVVTFVKNRGVVHLHFIFTVL